jgi:hypothetical protein
VVIARQRLRDQVTRQVDLEHGLAHRDHVTGRDHRTGHAVLADQRAVGAVEVLTHQPILGDANHTVVPRNVLIRELEVLINPASDGDF